MLGCRAFGCVRVCRECAELPAFFVAGGTLSGELLGFRKVERKADAGRPVLGLWECSCIGAAFQRKYRRVQKKDWNNDSL